MVNKSIKGVFRLVTAVTKIEIFALLILGMLVVRYTVLVPYSDPALPVPEKSPETESKEYFYA